MMLEDNDSKTVPNSKSPANPTAGASQAKQRKKNFLRLILFLSLREQDKAG
jgi:hypothetical protein